MIPKWKKKSLRKQAQKFQKNNCEICRINKNRLTKITHTQGLIMHHVIPIEWGGDSKINNLICICGDCHYRLHKI